MLGKKVFFKSFSVLFAIGGIGAGSYFAAKNFINQKAVKKEKDHNNFNFRFTPTTEEEYKAIGIQKDDTKEKEAKDKWAKGLPQNYAVIDIYDFDDEPKACQENKDICLTQEDISDYSFSY